MQSQPLVGEEIVCLLDDATDNYLLLRLGWLQGKRLYNWVTCVFSPNAYPHML
jgi:hypothetical protein